MFNVGAVAGEELPALPELDAPELGGAVSRPTDQRGLLAGGGADSNSVACEGSQALPGVGTPELGGAVSNSVAREGSQALPAVGAPELSGAIGEKAWTGSSSS